MNSNKLWAPWRTAYIRNHKKQQGCLFCRILKSNKDKDNFVISRTKFSLTMLNLYPYNNGHLMVAPKRHVRSLENLNNNEILDIMNSVKKAMAMLDKTIRPHGYNVGINVGRIGGAGFDKHLHIHIVPRWQGDTNFMPVVFNTKVISQSLEELYAALTTK